MLLRSLFVRTVNSRPRRSPRLRQGTSRQRRSVRPCTFERLEERTVLSTGIALTSISGYQDVGLASFLDANQKVVVAGFSRASSSQNENSALVRFTPSGVLDGTFGVGGAATQPMSTTQADQANAVVPLPDGKILVAGNVIARHQGKTAWDFAVARYNANGTLDATFGVGGVASVDFLGGEDVANALVLRSDGKIVAAGYATDATVSGSTRRFALACFTSAGQLDTSFGNGGIVRTPAPGSSYAEAVALHQGKILAVGTTNVSSGQQDFTLLRYNLNGSLDSTFGNGGIVTTDFGSHQELAFDVAVDAQERILVAGMLFGLSGSGAGDFAVARYLPNGALDGSFGTGGLARTEQGKDADAFAIALQGDGKIVLGGQVWSPVTADYAFSLIRYNVDGSLDDGCGSDATPGDSFGTAGKVVTPILRNAKVQSLAIQPDGKIVATGWAAFDGGAFAPSDLCAIAVARYNADGSLDTGFGADAPSFWINDGPGYVNEGNSGTTAYDFTVRLSSVSSVDVSVQYATANGTATAGSDYQAISGTLTIPAGSMSATITVLVNGDKTKEADKTFYVNLSNPTGATVGHGQGVGTIRNDDSKTSSTAGAGDSGPVSYSVPQAAATMSGRADSPTQAPAVQETVSPASTADSTLVSNAVSQQAVTGTSAADRDRDRLQLPMRDRDYLAVDLALQDLVTDLMADQVAAMLVP